MFKYRLIIPSLFLFLLFTGCEVEDLNPEYIPGETDAGKVSPQQTEISFDKEIKSVAVSEELIAANTKRAKERKRVKNTKERVGEKEDTLSDEVVTIEENPRNWYIRIVAEDPKRNLKSGSTQLGQLEDENAVVKHTLKAMGSGSLDVLFVDPKDVVKGKYKTNFHRYNEDSEDQWVFTVKSSDVNADILLSWKGVYILDPYTDAQERIRYKERLSQGNTIVKKMTLVDISSSEEVPMIVDGRAQTYTFNMGGEKEHTLKWLVSMEEVTISIENIKLHTQEAYASRKDAKVDCEKIAKDKAKCFDLNCFKEKK